MRMCSVVYHDPPPPQSAVSLLLATDNKKAECEAVLSPAASNKFSE